MTPAEHYAAGEDLLDRAEHGNPAFGFDQPWSIVTAALAHFVASIAGEMGVPTTLPTSPPQQPPSLPPRVEPTPSA